MISRWHKHATAMQSAQQLADVVESRLQHFFQTNSNKDVHALLAFPGGSTPAPFFAKLAEKTIDWSRVCITLGDERWVDSNHPRSNFAMMHQHLGVIANKATLVPLFDDAFANRPEAAIPLLSQQVFNQQHVPLMCILGMGDDGHFASLFPNMLNLHQGLYSQNFFLVCQAQSEIRISMTLHAIQSFRHIGVLVHGKGKTTILEQVQKKPNDLPISSLVQHTDVEVFSS